MGYEPDNKLTLEWIKLDDGRMALVFDEKTWKAFKDNARARDKTPEQMITTAVVGSFGPILMDNYTLNRFLRR
jgi:hypothetical protein